MFLTRFPIGRYASGDSEALTQSVRYFPFVGLLVALVMGCVLWLAGTVLPATVAVALSVLAGVMITGAFHEDGLADVADSAGAFGIEKKLEIMRDSRVGTYGALGLILLVLLRFVLLYELTVISIQVTLAALIVAHASGRWSGAFLMATVEYARAEAANKVVAQGVDNRILLACTLMLVAVLILPALLYTFWLYLVLAVVLLVSAIFAVYFKRAFKGVTGDCLGAANVIVEVSCLMVILAFIVTLQGQSNA